MSTRKPTLRKTPPPGVRKDLSAAKLDKIPSANLSDIEVTSLEIDDQYDADCDPYNRTGQFCVEALRRKND